MVSFLKVVTSKGLPSAPQFAEGIDSALNIHLLQPRTENLDRAEYTICEGKTEVGTIIVTVSTKELTVDVVGALNQPWIHRKFKADSIRNGWKTYARGIAHDIKWYVSQQVLPYGYRINGRWMEMLRQIQP